MRIIGLLLLYVFPQFLLAQDKYALINKADSFYQVKNYAMAAALSEEFLKADSTCDGCTYKAACYQALTGNSQKAVLLLKKAFILGYGAKFLDQDNDLISLHTDPQWQMLVKMSRDSYEGILTERLQIANEKRKKYMDWQSQWQENDRLSLKNIDTSIDAKVVYKKLKSLNTYHFIQNIHNYLFFYCRVNDSIQMPYTVLLPESYHPDRSYPLLVVLHGAVGMVKIIPPYADSFVVNGFHRHFTKYAKAHQMIMVFPYGNRQYNWMYPDDGFKMAPSIITYLKQFLNIDDNRIYMTGHSNGATGSFSYLMKEPNLFAAFSGMNTQPKVKTGGTFLPNAKNRSFYAIATDKDYYYPPVANDSLLQLAHRLGINWTLDLQKGYPHWFPQFDAADEPVKKMFDSLLSKKRDAFRKTLYWECDEVKYGRCDWLSITALDTLQQQAAWHKQYNFRINQWIDNENPDKIIDSTSLAFSYPRKSGAVRASYKDNQFNLSTSRVKSLDIYLSPEMIDFSKPVTVVVNGKKKFNKKIKYDKEFMLNSFATYFDRKAIWVNRISIEIK